MNSTPTTREENFSPHEHFQGLPASGRHRLLTDNVPQRIGRRERNNIAGRQGFALIASLTLLAFLLLLLVSLSSLTYIETGAAVRAKSQFQAEQNALLGLNIALGDIQKLAGPDRRTSASADVLSSGLPGLPTSPTEPSSDSGYDNAMDAWATNISAYWSTRSRHWSGVWAPADAPGDIFTKTPEAVFLGWLVSGADRSNYSTSTDPTGFGSVNPSDAADASMATDAVSGLSTTMLPTSTVTVGGEEAALLVGPNSLGFPTTTADFVVAPKVPVGSGAATSGKYAYWVGDEGIKARIDRRDPYADSGSDPATAEGSYRYLVAQRAGSEWISGFDAIDSGSGELEQIVQLDQLAMVPGLSNTSGNVRFHDVSVSSSGVLADTQRGGLREDLSYYLENSVTPGGDSLPGGGTAILSVAGADTVRPEFGPTWERLQSYYDFGKDSGAVTMRPASATEMGITAVVLEYRIAYSAVRTDTDSFEIRVQVAFVIGNPYTVPIQVDSLDFNFHETQSSKRFHARFEVGDEIVYREDVRYLMNNFRFRTGPVTIPAGRATVFSLSEDTPVTGSESQVVELMEGFNPATALTIQASKEPTNTDTNTSWDYDIFATNDPDGNSSETGGSYHTHLNMYQGGSKTILQRQEHIGFVPPESAIVGSLPGIGGTFTGFTIKRQLPTVTQMPLYSVRVHADYNIRAQIIEQTHTHLVAARGSNHNPLAFGSNSVAPDAFSAGGIDEVFWGMSLDEAFGGKYDFAMYDIPRSGSDAAPVFLSIGQLGHADLSAANDQLGSATQTAMDRVSISSQPGQALGNAWASPYVRRNESHTEAQWTGSYATKSSLWSNQEDTFDMSYLLNATLWDSYFFSTVPQSGSFSPALDTVLPNGRLHFREDGLTDTQVRDAERVAAYLMLDGAFNVNSTSVEAWRAMFGALHDLSLDGNVLEAPLPRSLKQTLGSNDADNGTSDEAWAGFRDLTSDQLDALAEHMVRQVRLRGPFLSLGHFINRELVDSPYVQQPDGGGNRNAPETAATELGLRGALQMAIDTSGLNDDLADDFADIVMPNENMKVGYMDWRAGEGPAAMGIPGWLTQADVLQPLGPVISARSDTFIVRAYGESLNPVTGNPDGRAWCEAVVQRYPEYVGEVTPAWTKPADMTAAEATVAANLGRGFRLVSFRWLNAGEI